MSVFFLSDLHLDGGNSAPSVRFSNFISEQLSPGDYLLLGGDIFDLLVGSKRVFHQRHALALSAIEGAARRGVRVHYLEGNHDFHFENLFRGIPNIEVWVGDMELQYQDRKIWVSHGDLIDEEDTGYRFLRFMLRNALFKGFVDGLPDSFVDFLGTRSSGASRKYTSARVENEGTERLRRLYLDYAKARVREGYRHVLLGHSHLRDQVPISERGLEGEYLNLGFSSERLLVGVLHPNAARFQIREIHT